jgi:DNA mismatch repair protein MutS2
MSERTQSALDWDVVLAALARHARTTRGMSRAATLPLAADIHTVRERYAEVAEVLAAESEGGRVPVGGLLDITDELERAGRGVTLEVPELRAVLSAIRTLHSLRAWLDDNADDYPRLAGLGAPIFVDPGLLEDLTDAFDAAGELSEARWPELGTMRRRVDQLRDRIRTTLDDILRADDWGDSLQDRFFTERDGRFVVPVKMAARRGLGIVHGTSNSGETAWVEPAVVVELHNELRATEAELARHIRRILAELTREVGMRHVSLLAAVEAATDIDLACARAGLGREMRAVIPTVGTDGVLRLFASRHPVLVLRAGEDGRDVVPNDLSLTSDKPGLVLTGPNAGGKTVALKTLGLAALLVRAAIPVPCEDGSRVDFFDPVLADIGDAQSVSGGLSTFSAHVHALNVAISGSRPGALVLLDEVAVGTDPAQGAALAHAVLEAIVDSGARVAVTTHYPELKALNDARFMVAAAQYADGKPTYRLELGVPGPSYALAMARRLGLPEPILQRAHALLEEGARELADRLERLTEERAAARRHAEELASRERWLAERERRLGEQERRLEREGEKRIAAMTEKAMNRLKRREEEVRTMVAALQAGADLKAANATLAGIREALAEARTSPSLPTPEPAPPAEVEIGDRVRVRTVGQVGRVTALGEQVEVEVGSLRMRVARENLELLGAKAPKTGPVGVTGKVIAGRAEKKPAPEPEPEVASARVRTTVNTCDLRGMRADEALIAAERFLDGMKVARLTPAFLLHGHGSGVLKQAVRAWLPGCRYAAGWRPADADEGGDAYTVVEVAG